MRRLSYYVGTTLDGYIAAPDGDADFFAPDDEMHQFIAATYPDTIPTHLRQHFELGPNPLRYDTAIMGRATYEPALEAGIGNPYAHLRTYVVSTTLEPGSVDDDVEIATDPIDLVHRLRSDDGADIWLVGGGALAGTLLPELDELVLKIYPVTAGTGVRLFGTKGFACNRFTRTDTAALANGTLVVTYRR